MMIHGRHVRGLQFDPVAGVVTILDQTLLPFQVEWIRLATLEQACQAIASMQVRGAPAIGAVAAFGMVLAVKEGWPLADAAARLKATRPTAVNLAWAVDRLLACLQGVPVNQHYARACQEAMCIADDDVRHCSAIGDHGVSLIEAVWQRNGQRPVNILTHCNAGWLAAIDWGTALAPVYKAQQKGIDVHVWVDETRPRNQGAALTCFELKEQGIAHTLVADNAGGLLMQQGRVDLCLVGSDRTTANGDVCNKVGTYLKALAAADNRVPFYVALPVSTIDWSIACGKDIPIEYRSCDEVLTVPGCGVDGKPASVSVTLPGTPALNPAFDVTPARFVSGLVTEYGVFPASPEGLAVLKSRIDKMEGA